ncbi:hypothetical protein BaRGS_00014941 [Batillaria attramentaria]|uniref:Uncharacterized protein n=1 Tax=Batillaria attramentaria TaxID=370345 RepID=A0ABD0L383_9CAEN
MTSTSPEKHPAGDKNSSPECYSLTVNRQLGVHSVYMLDRLQVSFSPDIRRSSWPLLGSLTQDQKAESVNPARVKLHSYSLSVTSAHPSPSVDNTVPNPLPLFARLPGDRAVICGTHIS